MRKIVLVIAILSLLHGCSKTIKSWNNSEPKEYLEVSGKDDLPLKLEAKKIKYRCVDLVYS